LQPAPPLPYHRPVLTHELLMRHSIPYQIGTLLLPAVLSAPALAAKPAPKGATAVLAVLETTDLHANVVGYDYFKLAAEPSIGLDRTASLIAQARGEFANTVLFDNGDTIQGNALADYQALVAPVRCEQTLGIYKVMNALKYDGASIGNHEFNYGLAFWARSPASASRSPASRSRSAAPVRPSRRCWPTSTA